ncbi:MAG: hypothetical protein WD906_08750 [Anaerolineales bacterium]
MPSRETGRFPLILYERVLSRNRGPATLLAILLLGLWYPVSAGWLEWPKPPADGWLLAGGFVSLAYALFSWIGPNLAFVKVAGDHLRIQTPIYRLKISYRRIASTRPVDFARMFPPASLSRGLRRQAQPYYGRTALGVNLNGFPLPPWLLRWFLHPFFFAADQVGLVLLVDDWMGLSGMVSAKSDAWRTGQQPSRPFARGVREILDVDEDEP